MKCYNCGNDIPDFSTSCPFCNAVVTPVTNEVKINEEVGQNTSVIPITPVVPVLPQDQGNGAEIISGGNQGFIQPVANPATSINTLVAQPVAATTVPLTVPAAPVQVQPVPAQPVPVQPVVAQPVPMAAPVEVPVAQPAPVQPTVAQPVPAQPVATEPVAQSVPAQPVVVPQPAVPTPVATAAPVINNGMVQPNVVPTPDAVQPQVVNTQVPQVSPVTVNTGQPVVVQTGASQMPQAQPVVVTQDVYGNKISAPAPVIKNKGGNPKVKILVIVIILLLLVGGGGFGFYYYQTMYNSAAKRIDVALDKFLSFTSSIRTDILEEKSGSYNFELDIQANDKKYGVTANGKYGYNLGKQLGDLTINNTSLIYEDELLNEDLNIEIYKYDGKDFLLLQNFFDKYIYSTNEDTKLFSGVSQNSIEYRSVINGLKRAFKTSVKAGGYSQTNRSDTIGGVTKNYNIVKLKLGKDSKERILNKFYDSISNNTDLLTQLSYFNGQTTDEVLKDIKDLLEKQEVVEHNEYIEFFTEGLNSVFKGIKYYGEFDGKKVVMEVVPKGNSYNISVKEDGKNILDGKYTKEETSTTVSRNSKRTFDFVYNFNNIAYTIKATLDITDDNKPNVTTVNTKESVAKEYLAEHERIDINTALSEFGEFGVKYKTVKKEVIEGLDALPIFDGLGTKIFGYFSDFLALVENDAPAEGGEGEDTPENPNTGEEENETPEAPNVGGEQNETPGTSPENQGGENEQNTGGTENQGVPNSEIHEN